MTVVYIDSLFLLNFIVDYLLLLATAKLAGEAICRPRLALGAAVGALYASAVFFPGMGFLTHPLCKLSAAIVMLLAGLGGSRRLLRVTLVFLGLSCAFGGGIFAIGLLGGRGLTLRNGILYSAMDLKIILLSAAVCYVALTLVFSRTAKHSRRELIPAVLSLGEKRVALTALVDTGNTLADPVTGRPVMVAEGAKLGPLLPEEVGELALKDPVGTMERLSKSETGKRFRLLPYQAVGVECGMLLALRLDRAQVGTVDYGGILVALSPNQLSDGGGYSALIGPRESKRTKTRGIFCMRGITLRLYVRIQQVLARLGLKLPGKIMYIGGSDTLPPPLARDEEAELIARMDGGDESVKSQLIERNLRLVVYIARRFENTGINIEDLISIGTIGLIKAVSTYKPAKNIKLATYASRCIENEILMYLRKTANLKSEVSFDEPLNTDWDGNELLLSDILGTENDLVMKPIEDDVDRQLLTNALEKLSERERLIITLRFGLDGRQERTQKEVADQLGISQSYISRLEKRIISRLKKEILRML